MNGPREDAPYRVGQGRWVVTTDLRPPRAVP